MLAVLWVVVGLPFLGALILAVFGAYMPKKAAGVTGVSSVGASWVCAMIAFFAYLERDYPSAADTKLYSWINVGGLDVGFTLHLDALSLVMMTIISFVAFLIHLYASQSMYDQDGYSRFFAYMNLFVGFMLLLVLAGNLLPLYLGWEGVGLCSFLLIGFWYRDAWNGNAARKAFIITRIGDTALAIALFLIFRTFGTLSVPRLLAASTTGVSQGVLTWIAVLILIAAVAKSAQVPLQTWLPDAMAGPTPVSALLHAATMVIAGVYLIAREHMFLTAAPGVLLAVAIIGTFTLIYAGLGALVQRDIKRILAYSTMSQIGYMFLALGVGAWAGAIFHFLTHAFFKALLFLSAGVVIDALDDEHDILRMGGLWRRLPNAFWTFLIGSASLAALPLVTAGWYSKDVILLAAWSSRIGGPWLWGVAMAGAFITAFYIFRAVFLVFFGRQQMEVTKQPGVPEKISLWVLAAFSIGAGFIWLPEALGNYHPFTNLERPVLPTPPVTTGPFEEAELLVLSSILVLLGIYAAYVYWRNGRWAEFAERHRAVKATDTFLYAGWDFDWLYDRLIVRPTRFVSFANRSDVVDKPFMGLGSLAAYLHGLLSNTQTGRLRDYAFAVALGAFVVTAIVLLR